jgi:glycogen operon protein
MEVIKLDPATNRTGDVWHLRLAADFLGKSYVFCVEGPWCPKEGHRFNREALLLDPYARALAGSAAWSTEGQPIRAGARGASVNAPLSGGRASV